MKDTKRRTRKSRNRDAGWETREPAAGPMELKPMRLRNEPVREISAMPIQSREMPLVDFDDRSAPARRVEERPSQFAAVNEKRYELRREADVDFKLQDIPVTEMRMRQLQARRLGARDLGWNVPGHRIRVDSGT